MRVIAIAAVASNGVIGSGGAMLWHLSEDFKRFKQVTMNQTLVLGRRTFEQIGILPGRHIIVVTRDGSWRVPGGGDVRVVHSLTEAVTMAERTPERDCYIGGGGQIYAEAMRLGLLTDLDITEVHQNPVGAVRFPTIDPVRWRELSRDPRDGFDFVRYVPTVAASSAV